MCECSACFIKISTKCARAKTARTFAQTWQTQAIIIIVTIMASSARRKRGGGKRANG